MVTVPWLAPDARGRVTTMATTIPGQSQQHSRRPRAAGALSRRGLLAGAAGLELAGSGTLRARAADPVRVTQFIWTGAQEVVPRRITEAYVRAHPDVQV